MNPPPAARSEDVNRVQNEIRALEEPPAARVRERLVQRVLVARKRLPQTPAGHLAKTR